MPARASVALVLVVLTLLAGSAARAQDDDAAARRADLVRRVWAAVDAPEDQLAARAGEIRSSPDVGWREVADVLAEPRPVVLLTPPQPPREELDETLAYLHAFPWDPGVVRAYDLGDEQRSWYRVTLPADADPEEPLAVLLDFGAFAPQPTAPQGWAVVRLHDALWQATDLGGVPFSLTGGTASQCAVLTILRDLERHVRFDPDRVFVAGFSRGGNAALYFGTHWPGLFAGVVPASGYYTVEDEFLANLRGVAVLAAWGTDPGHRDANAYQRALVPRLQKAGADVTPREQDGRATDGDFGSAFLSWAAERRRTALPRTFRHTLRDPRHRGAYWAEILEAQKTGGLLPVSIGAVGGGVAERFDVHRMSSSIELEVTAPNQVRLQARNVRRLRLDLSPALFDLEKPLTIRFGGRTFTKTPAPSIDALLAAFRRDHDRARLFPASVELEL